MLRRPHAPVATLVLSLLLGGLAVAAAPARLALEGPAKVSFSGKGPAGVRIVGTTTDLKLVDDGERLTFTVPLDTLKTGIDLRDRHMREKYLETARYPTAVLVVPRAAVQAPAPGQARDGEAKAQLTLHGRTKELPLRWRAERASAAGGPTQVVGTLRVDYRDFGIEQPGYRGITVKPDIDVEVQLGVVEAAPAGGAAR